jgi:hypothetical protein
VGDKVLATDTKAGKTQPETVAAVLIHHDTDLYDLKIQDHGKTSVIDTTSNHLYWVPGGRGDGQWVKADALKYGTRLRTPSGSDTAAVLGGWIPVQRDGWMWDLTVPGNNDHDFYINVTSADMLVHNDDCPTSPNQMQRQVDRGRAPAGIDRVDTANPGTDDAQPHIHFKGWRSTLNQDGTWGHGDGSDANLTNKMIRWLMANGWGVPGE